MKMKNQVEEFVMNSGECLVKGLVKPSVIPTIKAQLFSEWEEVQVDLEMPWSSTSHLGYIHF